MRQNVFSIKSIGISCICSFLVLAYAESVWAQSTNHKKSAASDTLQIPSGYQQIAVSGTVYDESDITKRIPYATLSFYFDGELLAQALTDEMGIFEQTFENYGGLKKIDIQIEANHYPTLTRRLPNIPTEKIVLNIPLSTTSEASFLPVFYDSRYCSCIVPESYPVSDLFYRTAYLRTSNSSTVVYSNSKIAVLPKPVYVRNVHFPIRVVNKQGQAVDNAKIELSFSGKETRWGITDANGYVKIRSQLQTKSFYAKLVISADGYFSKTIDDFELGNNQQRTYILKKKRTKKSS